MKGTIIFIIVIILFGYLFYSSSVLYSENNNNSNVADKSLNFQDKLSVTNYDKQDKQEKKRTVVQPILQKQKNIKYNRMNNQKVVYNNTKNNTSSRNTYKTSSYNKSDVSLEEIKRREKEIFNNLKVQQANQRRVYQAQRYTRNNQNYQRKQNNYMLGDIPIDKPPTYEQMQKGSQTQREYYIDENLKKGDRVIPVNPLSSFSYKSKQEVFDERKKYVSTSLFAYPGYEPSDEVFGEIEDGKPWISISFGKKNGMSDVEGLSEESRFINNPSVLVAADYNGVIRSGDEIERYNYRNTMPSSIKYIQSENLIEVVYPTMHLKGRYRLDGMNARDFGYKYARLDNNKSKNVYMQDFNSIATDIVEFKDFIHTGGSCGVPGGCNNGSPLQPMLIFKYPDQTWEVVLYIKLWREKPSSYDEPADINEKIIILPKYKNN